jgi:tetratricopeptide (TPR) repeat protein
MSRIWRWAGLTLMLVAWAGVRPSSAQTGGLTGKTIQLDGTPCVKCTIQIDRTSIKGHYETKTDKKGTYVYVGLPTDVYKVTLVDPNGKSLFYLSQRVEIGDPTELDFDLPKEMARQQQERQQEIQSNPELKKQQEEQEKAKQQFTSLKQLFDQGVALEGQKQFAEAAAMFQKAEPLAKDKNLLAVLEHEAESFHGAKNNDQAVAVYQKLIGMDPTSAEYHNNLGSIYADIGKGPEAQAEFAKAAQLDPAGASKYYFNLGAVMMNGGKMDEAAAAFKKATDADPTYADAWFMQGQALMGKASMGPDGKIVPAPGTAEALQTYLKLAPSGPHAADAQGMLQSIQGSVQTEFKVAKPAKKKKG